MKRRQFLRTLLKVSAANLFVLVLGAILWATLSALDDVGGAGIARYVVCLSLIVWGITISALTATIAIEMLEPGDETELTDEHSADRRAP